MQQAFERWVSLGNFCLTKYQINRHVARRYFGLEENTALKAMKLIATLPRDQFRAANGGNLFFDWVVVDSYRKIAELLRAGFPYDLAEASLAEIRAADGSIKVIRCNTAGIQWTHLFSREKSLSDWREQIPGLRSKVEHMRSGFMELRDFSTLYVMTGSTKFANSDLPDMLEDAISTARGDGAKDFRLLVCVPQGWSKGDLAERGRILFRPYNPEADAKAYPWLGHAASWDAAFADFSLAAPVTASVA